MNRRLRPSCVVRSGCYCRSPDRVRSGPQRMHFCLIVIFVCVCLHNLQHRCRDGLVSSCKVTAACPKGRRGKFMSTQTRGIRWGYVFSFHQQRLTFCLRTSTVGCAATLQCGCVRRLPGGLGVWLCSGHKSPEKSPIRWDDHSSSSSSRLLSVLPFAFQSGRWMQRQTQLAALPLTILIRYIADYIMLKC